MEPIGDARTDYQTAAICATVANSMRWGKGKAAKVRDYLADYWKHDRAADPRQIKDVMNMWAAVCAPKK